MPSADREVISMLRSSTKRMKGCRVTVERIATVSRGTRFGNSCHGKGGRKYRWSPSGDCSSTCAMRNFIHFNARPEPCLRLQEVDFRACVMNDFEEFGS